MIDTNVDIKLENLKKQDEQAERERRLQRLAKRKINQTIEIPDPTPVLRQGNTNVLTRGNISAVIGQAKARKTFLMTSLCAACLSEDDFLSFTANQLSGPVVWIDTEQAIGHVGRIIRRLKKILKIPKDQEIPNFQILMLREDVPATRREILEDLFEEDKPSVVFLDGVADLIESVNDEYGSTELMTLLLRLTSQHDCHIVSVIHLNPGRGEPKPRGHIGSEFLRKAETVLLVQKDNDQSKVIFERCRDIQGDEFNFFVNSEGIPQLAALESDEMNDEDKRNDLIDLIKSVMPQPPSIVKTAELIDLLIKKTKLKERSVKKKIKQAVEIGIIKVSTRGTYYLSHNVEQQKIDLNTPTEIPF